MIGLLSLVGISSGIAWCTSAAYGGWAAFAAVAAYLFGCAATMGVITHMGEGCIDTIGDSFSGDDDLDLTICSIWPAFWPLWLAYCAGRRVLD